MYFAVLDSDGKWLGTVEADSYEEAVTVAADEVQYAEEGSVQVREAEKPEAFRYLVSEIGLSQRGLAAELEVSKGYVGMRKRGKRSVRRLDILALERLRELKD